MTYGERLKQARKYAKLSQQELCTRIGIQQPSLSYLESGAAGSEFTVQLARACGISADWLADETGEMLPSVYITSDPKIIAAAKLIEQLPEYAKNSAVEGVATVAQLIERAAAQGSGQ
jgi:transcriptional regulator with XRE-family HTH domain